MQTFTWVSYSYAWVASLACIIIAASFRRRKLNQPPGPNPWPIIGNLNLMGSLPHRSIHYLTQKYGPIMQLQFGSFPVVVASSPDAAKLILKTHDLSFASRPRTAAGKYTHYNYSDIAWSPYGPYWRQARKMCLVELFSAKRLESFQYIRGEEQKALCKRLYDRAGNEVVLKEHLSTGSLNVISRMVLGKNFLEAVVEGGCGSGSKHSSIVAAPDMFKRMIGELAHLNGVLNIGDFIPWLAFLDLQGYIKRMKAVAKTFDAFMERLLDQQEEARRRGNYVAKCMLDVMLQVAEDPDLEVKLGRQGVKAFTQDLLAGGTESSAVSTEWVISEVIKKPDILKKVTDELDRVIGRERWVEEKDIPQLPYINAIVKEMLRLHPASPFLVPRIAREDCNVGGYDIRKGTRVLVNVWTIGRDPLIWDDPLEFNPERFIGNDIDVLGQDFELLPFGSGRRICPGISLGLKVIHSSVANLLHGFEWKLPGNMKPSDLNMDEVFGLAAPRKVPLVVIPEPRLPQHVYSL